MDSHSFSNEFKKFEKEFRKIVRKVLQNEFGDDWWNQIDINARSRAEKNFKKDISNNPSIGPIDFLDFKDLENISIKHRKNVFDKIFPNQQTFQTYFNQLNQTRNPDFHSRDLPKEDYDACIPAFKYFMDCFQKFNNLAEFHLRRCSSYYNDENIDWKKEINKAVKNDNNIIDLLNINVNIIQIFLCYRAYNQYITDGNFSLNEPDYQLLCQDIGDEFNFKHIGSLETHYNKTTYYINYENIMLFVSLIEENRKNDSKTLMFIFELSKLITKSADAYLMEGLEFSDNEDFRYFQTEEHHWFTSNNIWPIIKYILIESKSIGFKSAAIEQYISSFTTTIDQQEETFLFGSPNYIKIITDYLIMKLFENEYPSSEYLTNKINRYSERIHKIEIEGDISEKRYYEILTLTSILATYSEKQGNDDIYRKMISIDEYLGPTSRWIKSLLIMDELNIFHVLLMEYNIKQLKNEPFNHIEKILDIFNEKEYKEIDDEKYQIKRYITQPSYIFFINDFYKEISDYLFLLSIDKFNDFFEESNIMNGIKNILKMIKNKNITMDQNEQIIDDNKLIFFGLDNIVKEIETRTLRLFSDSKKVEKLGIKIQRSFLFWGPPGTGKTYYSKAISDKLGWDYEEINISSVLTKWLGESEKNLSDIFDNIYNSNKKIWLFDEVDSFSSERSSSDNETERRLVNLMLKGIQDIPNDKEIIVIGTTNNIWSIDPALLREGRFKLFFFPPLDDKGRKLMIKNAYNISNISERLQGIDPKYIIDKTKGLTGGELDSLLNDIKIEIFNMEIEKDQKHIEREKIDEIIENIKNKSPTKQWFLNANKYLANSDLIKEIDKYISLNFQKDQSIDQMFQ